VRVELALDRLEVEATAFEECDDCAALVTIRVQGAGPYDAEWLDRLTQLYLAWAEGVRRPAELLYEQVLNEGSSEPIAVLRIDGPFAFGYLKGEAGTHRMRDEVQSPDGVRTVSVVATVEVVPLAGAESEHERTVEFTTAEALRARGRVLQKVRSLVVARSGERMVWLQNGRNLQENRELAIELLLAAGVPAGRPSEAARVYQLCGRRKVRDPRTGLAVSGRAVDAYLAGQIDTFLRRNAPALRRYEEEQHG
jgi:peptide chain release factor 2